MKKLLTAALAAMMVLALAACGNSTPAPASAAPEAASDTPAVAKTIVEQIKEKGTLVLGTEAQYAPFEFKNEKADFVGCDIWLAEQIAAELGVELEVVDMAFDGIIPAVQSNQVDLGIAAFTVTPERAEEVDFSEVYQRDEQYLIIATDKKDVYTTKESLKGQQVGAQKGTVQSLLIKSALPESTLFELAKYPALAMEVANGNIAGLVVDGAVGENLVATNDKICVSSFRFSKEEANFGKAAVIKKGNDALAEVVNKVITEKVADGSFEKAYEEAVALAKTMGL